jgi:threonine/homoserine/homoserine lactone efflux protein
MQGKLTMGENGFRSGFGFGCGCVFGIITALLAALLALAFLGMHMKEQREKHKSQQQ